MIDVFHLFLLVIEAGLADASTVVFTRTTVIVSRLVTIVFLGTMVVAGVLDCNTRVAGGFAVPLIEAAGPLTPYGLPGDVSTFPLAASAVERAALLVTKIFAWTEWSEDRWP